MLPSFKTVTFFNVNIYAKIGFVHGYTVIPVVYMGIVLPKTAGVQEISLL